MKKLIKIITLILPIILIFFLVITATLPADIPTGTDADTITKVHYIDVGQGDCILIESNGKFMLIDAGKTGESDTVIDYLINEGVKKLDYVIWTHPDADHIGGAADVINAFKIGTVIMSDKSHTTKTFENLLLAMKNKGLKITLPKPGDKSQIGKAEFTIIAPNKEYEDNNNSSIGIKLNNGKTSFVFLGDAEEEAIHDILDNGINLKADVLLAGHHGSDTSTSQEFISAVNPDYSVISVGKDNNYGHPDESTLNLLNGNQIKIYRTDESGTIVAASDGKIITFTTKAYQLNHDKDSAKETTVYITQTGQKYHLSNCPYVNESKIETTLDDAKTKGLTPCSKCNPPK